MHWGTCMTRIGNQLALTHKPEPNKRVGEEPCGVVPLHLSNELWDHSNRSAFTLINKHGDHIIISHFTIKS